MDGLWCINQPERMKWIKELEKEWQKSTVGKCRNKIRMEINTLIYRKTVELIKELFPEEKNT